MSTSHISNICSVASPSSFINMVSITCLNRDRESLQHNAWLVLAVAQKSTCQPRPPCGKTDNCMCSQSQINCNLGVWGFFFFFSQTVILISENHKFTHLPFSLEVKCKGFRTEQASTSVTCQRAAEQKHIGIVSNTDIYIYIYLKKNLSYLVTLLLDYSHSSIFRNLHISINLLNLTNNSKMWLLFWLGISYRTCLHTHLAVYFSDQSFEIKLLGLWYSLCVASCFPLQAHSSWNTSNIKVIVKVTLLKAHNCGLVVF